MTADTPAGMRLDAYLNSKDFTESPFDPLDRDEMASIVLNTDHIDSSTALTALAGVLQDEFPMFQAPEETWLRVAKAIQTKLEQMRIFLLHCKIQDLSKEEE